MKRVWILRHAKSSWDHPDLTDHDRPLAPRGQKAGKRIARWADTNGVRPELVLCSTAVRAHATLELVMPGLGSPEVRIEAGLYHASIDALLELLAATRHDVTELLLVGHNPAVHELGVVLAPPGTDTFPTAALAGLRLEIDSWETIRPGCGIIETFIVPRALSG